MKLSVLTREINTSTSLSVIKAAAKITAEHGSKILILPGYHACQNPDYLYLDKIKTFSIEFNIKILIEAVKKSRRSTFLVVPTDSEIIEFSQHVIRGNDPKNKYKNLSDEIESNKRDFQIGKINFRVLLCGENNYFKNERKNTEINKAVIRYKDISWNYKYDVLLNPAHTTMGQWNLLNKRFEKLSENNKTVIFTTNKGKNNCKGNIEEIKSWSTALRVYKDGKLYIDGELKDVNLLSHIEEKWRLVTFNVG